MTKNVIILVVGTVVLLILLIYLVMSMANSNAKVTQDDPLYDDTLSNVTDDSSTSDPDVEVEDVAELSIETVVQGTGEESKNGDVLVVHYTGTLLDGTKFDSSVDRGDPFSFTLGNGNVIQGWEQGMLGMKVGEKRILIIPSDLGYGAAGAPPSIPGGAALKFEVELLEIQ